MPTTRRHSTIRWRALSASWVLATSLLASCGSGGTDADGPGTIALSIAPATATVQVGGSVDVTVTLTRGGGFAGVVDYTVEGAPSGVAGTVTAVDATTGTVRLSASASATPGTYSLTVRGKATGVSDATATLSLTVAVAAPGFYTFVLPTSPTNVTQGVPASISIGIVRYLGFAGDITFAITGLPVGVTAQFSPTVVGGVGTILGVTVGADVPPATYHLTVRGTAAGQTDVTAILTLVVASPPAFSLVVGTAALNVAQGSSSETYLRVTRGSGLTAPVSYSVTGVPNGLSAVVAPTSVADSVALTLSAAGGLAGGSYPIIVHATVTGAAEQTAAITVLVATGAGVDVHLDYSVCPQQVTQPPIWVAYQDGAGAWTRVNGAAGIYNFHVNGSVGAFAIVRPTGSGYTTSVSYLTQAELQTTAASCDDAAGYESSPPAIGSKTVTGTVAGLPSGMFAQIALGSGNPGQFPISGPATSYQLSGVLDGPQDLLALRYSPDPDRLVIRRDLDIPDGGTLAPIDFDGTEGSAPLLVTVQLSGFTPGVRGVSTRVDYLSGPACTINRLFGSTPQLDGSVQVAGVPTALQRSGDFHLFAADDFGNYTGGYRFVRTTSHLLPAQPVAFGSVMPTSATVTTLAGGYPRVQAAFLPPADYSTAGLFFHDGLGHVFIVTASNGYRGQSSAQIAAPDLASATGYLAATWAPSAPAAQVKIFARFSTQGSACSEGVVRYAEQVVSIGP